MIEIVWSKRTRHELEDILEYWLKRNKSNSYSSKILKETDLAIKLIVNNPNIGVETDHRQVNMRLIQNRFYLTYRIDESQMEILKFWDCRQNPISNKYFK